MHHGKCRSSDWPVAFSESAKRSVLLTGSHRSVAAKSRNYSSKTPTNEDEDEDDFLVCLFV